MNEKTYRTIRKLARKTPCPKCSNREIYKEPESSGRCGVYGFLIKDIYNDDVDMYDIEQENKEVAINCNFFEMDIYYE